MSDIIKIGTSPNWRGTYSNNEAYYKDNYVTRAGYVFRCKVNSVAGKEPCALKSGSNVQYELKNTSYWECVVDPTGVLTGVEDTLDEKLDNIDFSYDDGVLTITW